MTVELQLQVAGIDLNDEATEELLDERFPDYLWAHTAGITTVTIFSDGDVVADACHAIRMLNDKANIRPLRVYVDLVNVGEIARRIGDTHRETVRLWARDDNTFPEAYATLNNDSARGATKVYDWAEVLAWLKTERDFPTTEALPTPAQVAEINAMLKGVTDYKSEHWTRTLATRSTQPQNPDYVMFERKAALHLAFGNAMRLHISTEEAGTERTLRTA